jgi:hypothetical protein
MAQIEESVARYLSQQSKGTKLAPCSQSPAAQGNDPLSISHITHSRPALVTIAKPRAIRNSSARMYGSLTSAGGSVPEKLISIASLKLQRAATLAAM